MRISEVNAKLVRHPFKVQISQKSMDSENNSSQSEQFRLLHVERVSTGHLHITVESLGSNHLLTYRLINDVPDLNALRAREWIQLQQEPFMGNLVHQMRPPIYVVEGLIVEHLDD